jgi:peptide/nickel transport system substrate-binding protein
VFYSNPEVDELIDAATRAVKDDERRVLYASAQRLIAEDIPYVGLWYKTNVAVFQPDITGVRLSPIADFTFLKDVRREGPHR